MLLQIPACPLIQARVPLLAAVSSVVASSLLLEILWLSSNPDIDRDTCELETWLLLSNRVGNVCCWLYVVAFHCFLLHGAKVLIALLG